MLQIDIIGNSGDDLILSVCGHPNNGSSNARPRWPVEWRVQDGSGVAYIADIDMKSIIGNTNIFPQNHPPRAVGPTKKRWKSIIRSDAPEDSEYHYNIHWVKEGETEPRIFDPIIAIRPTTVSTDGINLLKTALAVVGIVSLSYIVYSKLTRLFKHKNW